MAQKEMIFPDREEANRSEALQLAVHHRPREHTDADTVATAQKYFEFLQGKSAKP